MVSFQQLDPISTSANDSTGRLSALTSLLNNKLDNKTAKRAQDLAMLQQIIQTAGPEVGDYLQRKAERDINRAGNQGIADLLGAPLPVDETAGLDSGLELSGLNRPPQTNSETAVARPVLTSELLSGATTPTTPSDATTSFPVATPSKTFKLNADSQPDPRLEAIDKMTKAGVPIDKVLKIIGDTTGLTNEGKFAQSKIRNEDANTFNTTYQGANQMNEYNVATGNIGSSPSRSAKFYDAKIAAENRSNTPTGSSGGGIGFANNLTKAEINNQLKMLDSSVKARNLIAPMRAAIQDLKDKFPDGSLSKNKMAALMAGKYYSGASAEEKALATLAGSYNELAQATAKANQPGALTDRDIQINKEIAGDLGWETWGSLENKLNQVEANMKAAQDLHAGILRGDVNIYDTSSPLPGESNITGSAEKYKTKTTGSQTSTSTGETELEAARADARRKGLIP